MVLDERGRLPAASALLTDGMDVDLTPLSASEWRAFGLVPRPSFLLKTPLNLTVEKPPVRRVEKRYILPFQEHADEMFNSALVFEISALKSLVEPLLRQVPFGTHEYIEAKRLLAFIEWFLPMDIDIIPDNSILREFIGNSILKDYKAWRH